MKDIRNSCVSMRFCGRSALALWALLFLAGVNSAMAAGSTPVVISAADAGKTVSLALGSRLTVCLEAQPGTGFGWEPDAGSTSLLSLASVAAGHASMPGAGQTQCLSFVAGSSGKGQLDLVYRRPWEKEIALAKRFSIGVKVTPK